ncbi:MAG: hypothetical protein GY801_30725 [bacterium]|nr:hypothetical protein [bacterium]
MSKTQSNTAGKRKQQLVDIVFLIALLRNLQKKYGTDKGDEIMARFIMPMGLKYHFFPFHSSICYSADRCPIL